MKKVAVIMESWMRYFTFAWPSGILRRISETEEDVCMYIFNSSANWNDDGLYNLGEHNIFNLPTLTDYDGIILDVNNTRDPALREEMARRIRESRVYAVAINNSFDGLYSVGIDNYSSIKQVVSHLHDVHGARTFWFIMGPSDNYENMERERAIRDFLTENDITDDRYAFFSRDYDFPTGRDGFNMLYKEHGHTPDAIVCANDNIAVGVLAEAEKLGLKAPDDFLITGFDDLDKSRYFTPRISTVSYIREDAGYAAMDMLLALWRGENIDRVRHTDSHPIFWESCGCESDIAVDSRERLKNNILWEMEVSKFEGHKLALDASLAHVESMSEILSCIPAAIPSFKCDAMYLVMDARLIEADPNSADMHSPMRTAPIESDFPVKGYPDKLRLAFEYTENSTEDTAKGQIVEGIFPEFECNIPGMDFLFLPLHFREKTIGYFAIKNALYLMERQLLFDVTKSLTTGMEQLFSRRKLANMNRVLTALSSHDPMTGLYNRLGYTQNAEDFYARLRNEHRRLTVLYLDLDRLKYINDNFGHEHGDHAIKTVSGLIRQASSEEGYCFRLGGDEFLVLDVFQSDEDTREKIAGIQQNLERISIREFLPMTLTVSAGYVVGEPDGAESLDELVRRADDLMYQDKMKRRMTRE